MVISWYPVVSVNNIVSVGIAGVEVYTGHGSWYGPQPGGAEIFSADL